MGNLNHNAYSKGSFKRRRKLKKNISYYKFINLPRSRHYFPNDNPRSYLELVPTIRKIIVSKLQERPYEENELFKELDRYNPSLALALDYIFYEVEQGDDWKFKQALDVITSGIEVRVNGRKNYWGLTSKLDFV